ILSYPFALSNEANAHIGTFITFWITSKEVMNVPAFSSDKIDFVTCMFESKSICLQIYDKSFILQMKFVKNTTITCI
ncbi:hypothetical protein ABH063_21040, partial [Bacteroides ovatus]